MERTIVGFRQDEAGDWVAQLACGHQQHVRHDPPWQVHPWVVDADARARRIGSPLRCGRCSAEEGA